MPYADPQKERKYRRKYAKANPEVHARAEKVYAQKLKRIVIGHYCGKKIRCQCPGCHTKAFVFLSTDHKNGKGHKQRIGVWRSSGKALWLWIINHGFPKNFQILCWNCNCAKRTNNRCPMAGRPH